MPYRLPCTGGTIACKTLGTNDFPSNFHGRTVEQIHSSTRITGLLIKHALRSSPKWTDQLQTISTIFMQYPYRQRDLLLKPSSIQPQCIIRSQQSKEFTLIVPNKSKTLMPFNPKQKCTNFQNSRVSQPRGRKPNTKRVTKST